MAPPPPRSPEAHQTILICGYGPGISSSVAFKFGAAGYRVALVGRSHNRTATGAAKLQAAGIFAKAFVADLSSVYAIASMVNDVGMRLGRVSIVHYNAEPHPQILKSLLEASLEELQYGYAVSFTGLIAVTKAALPMLKASHNPSLLVTTGASGYETVQRQCNGMGMCFMNAGRHKLVQSLEPQLNSEGVYVGEVVVNGLTAPSGEALIETGVSADDVADEFWRLHTERPQLSSPLVIGTPKAGVLNVHNGGLFECLALASTLLDLERFVSYYDLAYLLSGTPRVMANASWPILAAAFVLVLCTLMLLLLIYSASPYIWPRCCHEQSHICCLYYSAHAERCLRCSYSINCCVAGAGWREMEDDRFDRARRDEYLT